ncbi:MAG: zf-HC2 domain-containing protein [Oscillospiraceae bacterium]|nr:zf-HC2 domain-containing protein [Oscillospiraceae bacterium]
MTCDFDRIDALCAGELPESQRASVLAHMEHCPACRAYYEAMAGLEGEETAPEGFTARVMDAVRTTPQQKVRRKVSAWRSFAAVAACAVLVLGLGFGSGLMGADSAAPESANDSAPGMTRDLESDFAQYNSGDDAEDLPLTIHVVEDPALCGQVRSWLAGQNIPQLYPDGPREAYDLTAEQVQSINRDIPLLALPEEFLQLELKSAE